MGLHNKATARRVAAPPDPNTGRELCLLPALCRPCKDPWKVSAPGLNNAQGATTPGLVSAVPFNPPYVGVI